MVRYYYKIQSEIEGVLRESGIYLNEDNAIESVKRWIEWEGDVDIHYKDVSISESGDLLWESVDGKRRLFIIKGEFEDMKEEFISGEAACAHEGRLLIYCHY